MIGNIKMINAKDADDDNAGEDDKNNHDNDDQHLDNNVDNDKIDDTWW